MLTNPHPGRGSRGLLNRGTNCSLVHRTVSAKVSAATVYPWFFASLNAQAVMVPWWQVAQPRSFRHFAASVTRNSKALPTACWDSCEAEVAWGDSLGSSDFLESSAPASRTLTRQSDPIATWIIQRECIAFAVLKDAFERNFSV